MEILLFFFSLHLSYRVYSPTDNLSEALQNQKNISMKQ